MNLKNHLIRAAGRRGQPVAVAVRLAMAGIALVVASTCLAAGDTIVVGQSLPTTSSFSIRAGSVEAGTRAFIQRVNAAGGINGRLVELVTLDDSNDIVRYAANVRELVRKHKAVALLNCLGDKLCHVAAREAADLRVALIGALSGDTALDRRQNPYVFRLRADYDKEADAMAKQLKQMGAAQIGVISETNQSSPRTTLLLAAIRREGLKASLMPLDKYPVQSLDKLMADISSNGSQALVLDIGQASTERLIAQGFDKREQLPRIVMTASTDNLLSVLGAFRGRAVGFSAVVPNPEVQKLSLARELDRDSSLYTNGWALTFDGMEGYLAARLLAEALHRTGSGKPDAQRLYQALSGAGTIDLGGFSVSFAPGRSSGSDVVNIGVRSRDGMLLN